MVDTGEFLSEGACPLRQTIQWLHKKVLALP